MKRRAGLVLLTLLPLSLAHAQAKAATKGELCTEGRAKGPDTAGHCCWAGQVWSSVRNTCVGIPTCPMGTVPQGEVCATLCPGGQVVTADTAGHCCYPAQVWSASRNLCVGIPSCPVGQRAEGESCVVACSIEGQVATADTAGQCCWPNQVWSNSRSSCMGTPSCPEGLVAQGADCVAGAPQPMSPTPVATPAPNPNDSAPVPMDAAPVPMDTPSSRVASPSPTPAAGAPVAMTESHSNLDEENLKRSLWVLGVDFLIDMSSGRFGLRLRTDIPLYRGHWAPQLGFGLSVLPPSFIAGTNNVAWALPLECTVGMRIPLVGNAPPIHLVPRAGVAAALLVSDRGAGFALKVNLGLGVRLNFGGAFGINVGFDALIPAVGGGFVWLTTVGIST